ncbi:hypothetical protein PGN35_014945 [Nodosilinea sp. PGN35]|nr:hypothetical protein [Nodosilinea sp. TSF1-S3]MDF0369929.1 hypothetical protein [Nodosilinea sp. TSF1-S3]
MGLPPNAPPRWPLWLLGATLLLLLGMAYWYWFDPVLLDRLGAG